MEMEVLLDVLEKDVYDVFPEERKSDRLRCIAYVQATRMAEGVSYSQAIASLKRY